MAAQWIDDWWYERDHFRAMAIAVGIGVAMYAAGLGVRFGLGVTQLPVYAIVTTAQFAPFINELHTLYLAARHRTKDLFDQPQTFERLPDGSIVRNRQATAMVEAERATKQIALAGKGIGARIRWHARDYWFSHRRLPQFTIGVGAPLLAFVLGAIGVPLVMVAVVTYGGMVLEGLPEFVLAVRAKLQHSLGLFKKPQMVPRSDVEFDRGRAPELVPVREVARRRPPSNLGRERATPFNAPQKRVPDRAVDGL